MVHYSDPCCCFGSSSLTRPYLLIFLKLERFGCILDRMLHFDLNVVMLLVELQDSLIVKHPKKNPLVLRMLVLMFVMVCGVYICAVCMKQIGGNTTERLLSIPVAEKPCDLSDVEPSEKPYVHLPKPETFSRLGFVWSCTFFCIRI